jgi:hypothetical protein
MNRVAWSRQPALGLGHDLFLIGEAPHHFLQSGDKTVEIIKELWK